MTAEIVVAVGVSWLILASGTLIPLVQEIVTKDVAPAWLRGLVLAVLSAVAGVATTAISTHGQVPLQQSLYMIATTAVVALAAHYGLNVAGVLPAVRKATARIGVGAAPVQVIELPGYGRIVGPPDAVARVHVVHDSKVPPPPPAPIVTT